MLLATPRTNDTATLLATPRHALALHLFAVVVDVVPPHVLSLGGGDALVGPTAAAARTTSPRTASPRTTSGIVTGTPRWGASVRPTRGSSSSPCTVVGQANTALTRTLRRPRQALLEPPPLLRGCRCRALAPVRAVRPRHHLLLTVVLVGFHHAITGSARPGTCLGLCATSLLRRRSCDCSRLCPVILRAWIRHRSHVVGERDLQRLHTITTPVPRPQLA